MLGKMCKIRDCSEGFSLTEILVLVGMVIVLIAILIPALARARNTEEEKICINNLKQLHMAVIMYAGNHDDYLVPYYNGAKYGHWFNLVPRYLGRKKFYPEENGIMCPSNPAKKLASNDWTNYAMNADVGRGDVAPTNPLLVKGLGKVSKPNEAVLFSDAGAKSAGRPECYYTLAVPVNNEIKSGYVSGWLCDGTLVHGDGLNAVFLDGHAEYLSRKVLEESCTKLWEMDD